MPPQPRHTAAASSTATQNRSGTPRSFQSINNNRKACNM
jgi:hypothetical protein